jgi:hypothetical protein
MHELTMMSEYSHVAESERAADLEHVGAFAIRNRFYRSARRRPLR